MTSSWKVEVLAGSEWCGNGMRFASKEEADRYGADLLRRWTIPTDARSVESSGGVNYRLDVETGVVTAVAS